jgi:hypothetical protein
LSVTDSGNSPITAVSVLDEARFLARSVVEQPVLALEQVAELVLHALVGSVVELAYITSCIARQYHSFCL